VKKVFKKNQIVIAVLAVMIAAAGISELFRKNFWLEKQNSRDGKRDGK